MSESTLPASAQATPKTQPAYRARGARNWPLWLGVLLVAFVFYLAVDGPNLAPRDPLQENFIVQHPVTGKFIKPPFPAFTMPGFPLGADQFGRDILSQLLWAVRPTLTMVLVVAALRLVVGTAMGLASGWSGRWVGRVLDVLISGALAAPVLFVALCVIAAFGIRWGVWAFILGLSITGWAEAARIIREQARSIKGQPYVEAARAVGASDVQLLIRHVLPQMMPLVWMLFSFEASSTLLTSAGLGFLGYFIHSVWIPLGDFTGIRATGRPELGQMLAAGTSADMQRQPWAMLAAGAMVFITVLGFNLLGEGLRLRLSLENLRRRKGLVVQVVDNAIEWAESRWFDPLSAWRRNLTTVAVLGSLLLLIFGGGWFLWQSQLAPQAQSAVAVPGGHQWAAAQHDAQGTLWTQVTGPADPSIAWVFTDQSGFTGGPAVAADGTVYVAAHSGTLYALNPDGAVLWQAELQRPPLGNPALGELGDVYVLDEANGLTAFTKEGRLRWDYESQTPAVPLASPIVGPDGTIYLVNEAEILALSVDGEPKWTIPLPTFSYASPLPRLSPAGEYLFFEDVILDARTGRLVFGESPEPLDKYIVGTNGRIYLSKQTELLEWRATEVGAEITQHAQWDGRSTGASFRFPRDAGMTPDGRIWVYYESGFEFAKLVWLDGSGQFLASLDYPYRGAVRLIGIDGQGTAYVCGLQEREGGECRANKPSGGAPVWRLGLEQGGVFPVGGALAAGRLYVALGEGRLYALADAQPAP